MVSVSSRPQASASSPTLLLPPFAARLQSAKPPADSLRPIARLSPARPSNPRSGRLRPASDGCAARADLVSLAPSATRMQTTGCRRSSRSYGCQCRYGRSFSSPTVPAARPIYRQCRYCCYWGFGDF
jgi:hypothetical protein